MTRNGKELNQNKKIFYLVYNMNGVTVFLKVIKLPVVLKEKTTKVDMTIVSGKVVYDRLK